METPLKPVGCVLPGEVAAAENAPAATTSMQTASLSDSPASRQPFLKRVTSFSALLAVLLVVAVFVPLRDFNVDPDLWWHLEAGQGILATHHWPTADTYSFTARGAPWIAGEWLGETLLAVVHRHWGLRGLMALNMALGAAILLALYALASLRSGNSKAAFVACALLLPFAVCFFTSRPQMLGFLFLIVTLIILQRFRERRTGALWLLPLLFLLWVNTHGSFVVGIFAFAVYGISGLAQIRWGGLESARWTARERLHLGLTFLGSLIALAITPYGVKAAGYPIDMAFQQPGVVANIEEWGPMPFNLPLGKVFLALLVGYLVAQVTLRLTWQLAEFILFLVGIIGACLHMRLLMAFVPFYALLLVVILSRWVPPYDPRKDKYALNALLMMAILVGIVRFFPTRERLEGQVAERWPVKAVRYIEQHHPPRPMFNTHRYGGYLIFALDGRYKVFVDSRNDIYERSGVLADYGRITGVASDTLALLWAYNVQSCLIERNEPLATLLSASKQWKRVYADEMSALFVRSKGVVANNER